MSESLFAGVDHSAIACYDAAKQAEWYCRYLGMKIIKSSDQNPPAFLVGYGAAGSAMIELMPARDLGPPPAELPRFCAGMRHLAIAVPDFARAYEYLKEAGIVFLFEPGEALGGGKVAGFRDPEGNELQIVER